MRDFDNDLVFEIVKRLPLKEATRFKVLNKTLYSYISDHIQHKHFVESNHKVGSVLYSASTMDDRNYMCQVQLDKPKYPLTKYIDKVQRRGYLRYCEIIASCGGLVLIYSNVCKSYCIFNPITTEFQLVPSNVAQNSVGLAVDSVKEGGQNSYRYRFRLVGFISWPNDDSGEKTMFKFTTFGFDSTQCWRETDPQEFSSESSFNPTPNRSVPVYLHGCMHWLLHCRKILSFDLGKGRARTIDVPRDDGYLARLEAVQDLLVFCISVSNDYLIYTYDHIYTEAWQFRHKIEKKEGSFSIMAFDAERILLDLRWRMDINGRNIKEMYVHDTWTKGWKHIARMPEDIIHSSDRVMPFVPTLAKLYSGLYFNCQVSQKKLPRDIGLIVDGLYQLFFSAQEKRTVNHEDNFGLNMLFEDESCGDEQEINPLEDCQFNDSTDNFHIDNREPECVVAEAGDSCDFGWEEEIKFPRFDLENEMNNLKKLLVFILVGILMLAFLISIK